MPDTLVKLKTGTIARMEQKQNNEPVVQLEEGSVYFAVDVSNPNKGIGKILYDAPDGNGGVIRVIMSTQAEIADRATLADLATRATTLSSSHTIDGVEFDGSGNIVHYGSCSTAGNTAAKTVTCANFVLAAGARIAVTFTNTNTASNPTLNVNNTGAAAIYYKNTNIDPSTIVASGTYEFVYDGQHWRFVGTDTDTKVTSVDNHYSPTANASAALSVDASSSTAATWNTTSLVTGVNIQRDAKGHVTGVTVDSIKMPANPNSDTKVRQTLSTSNEKYPLLLAYSNNATTTANIDNVSYRNNSIYANPSTGQINATKVQVAEVVTLEYNSTTKSLDFIFA